jgi:hypothetical protein
MRVHKWEVPIKDEFHIHLPKGAKILSFQTQRGVPCIWALVDEQSSGQVNMARHFRIAGTGHKLVEGAEGYVGTIQTDEGTLVWHLFDLGERDEILAPYRTEDGSQHIGRHKGRKYPE